MTNTRTIGPHIFQQLSDHALLLTVHYVARQFRKPSTLIIKSHGRGLVLMDTVMLLGTRKTNGTAEQAAKSAAQRIESLLAWSIRNH